MHRGRAEGRQRFEVGGAPIAFVVGETISRMLFRERGHDAVALNLCVYSGSGYGPHSGVASDDGCTRNAEFHLPAVNEHVLDSHSESIQCPAHREHDGAGDP